MTVPIATSPGRSGFGPQLSLSYDSGAGQRSVRVRLEPFAARHHAQDRQGPAAIPRRWKSRTSSSCPAPKTSSRLLELPNGAWVRQSFDAASELNTSIVQRYRPRIEGLVRAHRTLDAQAGRRHAFGGRSPRTTSPPLRRDPESRVADPAIRSGSFSWLICAEPGRQRQCHRLRLRGRRFRRRRSHARRTNAIAAMSRSANRYLSASATATRVAIEAARSRAACLAALKSSSTTARALPGVPTGRAGSRIRARDDGPRSQPWPVRQDPFSSLPRRLRGAHLPALPAGADVPSFSRRARRAGLSGALDRLHLRETPIASFITDVTHRGYRPPGRTAPT